MAQGRETIQKWGNFMEREKDVIYRCIGNDFNSGVIACGYMPKPDARSSQHNFVIGYYSCFIVLSGAGTYSDADHKNIPIKQGSFVQRLPGRTHTTAIVPDGQWLEFFISFGKPVYDYMNALGLLPPEPVSPSAFSRAAENGPDRLAADSPDRQAADSLDRLAADSLDRLAKDTLDRLLKRLKEALPEQYPALLLDMQRTVLALSRRADTDSSAPQTARPQFIQQACAALSSDFTKNISLPALACQFNQSYESFRKQFKKYVGTSPGSYRQKERLSQAALLINSGISIKEAALMTGYADTYAFTREFTKAMGCSPGKYRKLGSAAMPESPH